MQLLFLRLSSSLLVSLLWQYPQPLPPDSLSIFINTPEVTLPIFEILLTSILISIPSFVIINISLSSSTSFAPTRHPLFQWLICQSFISSMCTSKFTKTCPFPIPYSDTTSRVSPCVFICIPITTSSPESLIPLTPSVFLPVILISVS